MAFPARTVGHACNPSTHKSEAVSLLDVRNGAVCVFNFNEFLIYLMK